MRRAATAVGYTHTHISKVEWAAAHQSSFFGAEGKRSHLKKLFFLLSSAQLVLMGHFSGRGGGPGRGSLKKRSCEQMMRKSSFVFAFFLYYVVPFSLLTKVGLSMRLWHSTVEEREKINRF